VGQSSWRCKRAKEKRKALTLVFRTFESLKRFRQDYVERPGVDVNHMSSGEGRSCVLYARFDPRANVASGQRISRSLYAMPATYPTLPAHGLQLSEDIRLAIVKAQHHLSFLLSGASLALRAIYNTGSRSSWRTIDTVPAPGFANLR
jgi:hypothetical protein